MIKIIDFFSRATKSNRDIESNNYSNSSEIQIDIQGDINYLKMKKRK